MDHVGLPGPAAKHAIKKGVGVVNYSSIAQEFCNQSDLAFAIYPFNLTSVPIASQITCIADCSEASSRLSASTAISAAERTSSQ